MRVPDAFFMLHLLAAMVLLVDVLTALSNSTQTLQNKIRDAIDRRLWVQDSQVQTKVIGDEERVPSNSLLHVSLSSIPIERDAVLSRFPEICKTTTLVPPSQYSSIADYSNLLKQMEPELNMNQIQDLLKKFKDNTVSVVQRNQPNSPLPTNIDTSSPYVRSALYIAQKLTNFKKESVDFHLEGLIRYGFTRDEVEAILRTAGYGDLDVQLNTTRSCMK
ncbi:RxLR-like protein [Plasmopara halstedii]|uniref:RxLR-like protein n=1 Tax=Plasmopara halstedii TaxID=4781 RepID=A0A0P1AIL5_PLAHL|nr:RxLR-like protein [Plasmopara halstedii]CEG40656.1 RxLR-like protein [Plasmopara halstedii]|eukprot:XP_024577025.1 RxLR-like protein [Plasmopara halstedii]